MIRSKIVYSKYLYYLFYCGTPRKIFNFILNKIEKRFRKIHLNSMATNIVIGPSSICNLKCPGCPTGAMVGELIDRQMLSFESFKYIFEQVKDYVFNINLFFLGEPFLNEEIFQMIEHASRNRCGVTIHSNFNVFDEEMAEKAIKSRLTHIYLSIDGATQEVYEKYRKGGDLAKVLKNIEILVKKKKEMKSIFPLLTWKFLYFPHNVHEIELARQKAREIGVDSFEIFCGNIDNIGSFGITKYYSMVHKGVETVNATLCNEIWDNFLVHPDGSVLPCCHGFRKKDVFGNIYEKSFWEIWNNDDFINLRRMIKTGKIDKFVRYPCIECGIMNSLKS